MWRYVIKRLLLMVFSFFVIMTISFFLIRLVPDPVKCTPTEPTCQAIKAWREELGYNKPIIVQYWLYLGKVFQGNWGIGFKMYRAQEVTEVLFGKLPYTMYVNFFASIIAIPIGIGLGIYSALKKNKWQDSLISVLVMLVISVPSYVYCFIIQYFLCFRWGLFPYATDVGSAFFDPHFFYSYMPPILCLSLGTIAGLTRFTRAELTEALTSEYMLLARAKGLTRGQATVRHALKNAMVPIFPMIIGEFISIIGGSLIVENFFSIPGVGGLFLESINKVDTNFFMFLSMFYVSIGLVASLIVDLSYGWIDPRIRMGAR